ncbi:alpha/beta hydrolase family protein [Christiangramia sp. OXR-203]|uniref:alpha/beta hydrolase family protein n=1 Tax=Christiangramia sp. OXR-203 TaxID=3100176 RepID=UPI002AC951CC|nr:alpha/beta hydrolase [Christiangramia sp. OXR-203]WPY99421.1 alpha/beta hydrolase [Christiangramia sp. OXR-203]
MKKSICFVLMIISSLITVAQDTTFTETELSIDEFTDGTITIPAEGNMKHLIIFIQGSGPTDRNGNQPMLQNDGIKKIARELAGNGIASFRYDKRIFKAQKLQLSEEDMIFEDFVKDANNAVKHFRKEEKFSNIIIAGHSEGSLIGMLVAQENADAFISLAGAADPIDEIITEQVTNMAPELGASARTAFDEMAENGRTSNYSPMLEAVFRPSVQPFMASWMKYNPSEEISKLKIPVLVVNGTSDIQVSEEQAQKLAEANENSELAILDQMNHIFRKIETKDRLVNSKSYNEPNLPLHPELVSILTEFVKELD